MKKIVLLLACFLLLGQAPFTEKTSVEVRLKRLEDQIELMRKHIKTTKLTIGTSTDSSIVTNTKLIHWKSPNSWNIANGLTNVAIAPNWTTYDATDLTSADARYIYLLAIHQHTSIGNRFVFRENGQTNSYDTSIYSQVVNITIAQTFWQKMDTDQKFQYQTAADGETIFIRCIAYME